MSAFELFGLVCMTLGPFTFLFVNDWFETKRRNADFAKRYPHAKVKK